MQNKRIGYKTWRSSFVQTAALVALLCQTSTAPALSYELLVRQYTNTLVFSDFYRAQREQLVREVGKALRDKGLSNGAVVSVTLDFDGNVKNLKLVSGAESDQKAIANIHLEQNFGQLPGFVAPAAATLKFSMNELAQNPFASSKTELYQTSSVPDYSVSPNEGSDSHPNGSFSFTEGDSSPPAAKSVVKHSAYSKTDEAYDNAILTLILQKEQNYFAYNSRAKTPNDNGPELLTQAKSLEGSKQLDSAALVYAAAAFCFSIAKDQEQTTKALSECLRISEKCSDCNKLALASKLFSMKRQQHFPAEQAFTGFEDTAKSILNNFSSKNHRTELARLTLMSTNMRKQSEDTGAANLDEKILALTQQIADEQLQADVLQSYAQLQRRYTQMKDYAKAKQSAEEELLQSQKKAGCEAFDMIPALCSVLNFYITNKDLSGINSVLKRIDTASQDCRYHEFIRQGAFNMTMRNDGSTSFGQSIALAQQTLPADLLKSLQETFKKTALKLDPGGQRFGNQKIMDLVSYLVSAGKAEEALSLLDKEILVQMCAPDNRDNTFQIREIEILAQNEDIPNRIKRLDSLKQKREETLRAAITSAIQDGSNDKTPQLVTAHAALIKYLLEQKRTAEAQSQFSELASALDKAPENSNNFRSYYTTLLSMLRTVKDQPSLDRKIVLSTLKLVLKKDNYKSPPANFVPGSQSDRTDFGDEVVSIFLEDATTKMQPMSPELIPLFKNVVSYYNSSENYDLATTYEKKVLQIQEQTHATEVEISRTKSSLASFYAKLGQIGEADTLAREILQATSEPDNSSLPGLVSDLCEKWLEKDQPERAADLFKLANKARTNSLTRASQRSSAGGMIIVGSNTTSYDTVQKIVDAFEKKKDYDKANSFLSDVITSSGSTPADEDRHLMQFSLARLYLDKCSALQLGSEEKTELVIKSSNAFEDAIKSSTEKEDTANLKVDWRSNWYANKRVIQLKQIGEEKAASDLQKRL